MLIHIVVDLSPPNPQNHSPLFCPLSPIYIYLLHMPTTIGRWGSKVACNLLLKNARDEKHFSSSTLLRMWIMAICANLRYLGKKCVRTWDASIVFQIQVNGFKSKGGYMVALNLIFIHNLNIPYYTSSPQRLSNDATNELEPPNPRSFGSWY